VTRVHLVAPLEDDWREVIDDVARARSWPESREVARLGAAVAQLSAAYNDPARASARARDAGAARLGFSFARDVPKGAAAVRELVAVGALATGGTEPLRVLDLGAGLGASTWGVVRALAAAGSARPVEATWVDPDAQALEVGAAIVRARAARGGHIDLRVRAVTQPATASLALGGARFDVVLVGQLLSELDVGAPDEARLARHADLLRGWLETRVAPRGALVVIEPALRDRTRHLHRVRDALVAGGAAVFAPCLHGAPCPALARDTDWCHEDLDVDLPGWLVPVARAAGLRHEGLTFSYLVLRAPGADRLVEHVAAPPGAARMRVVSSLVRTKGKREVFLCGEFTSREGGTAAVPGASLVAGRARVMRLDRDASDANAVWTELRRGDLAVVSPAPELERPRVAAETAVRRVRIETLTGETSLE
jgi:ribosomal protein RSM22 (predicted rRNA methylase)